MAEIGVHFRTPDYVRLQHGTSEGDGGPHGEPHRLDRRSAEDRITLRFSGDRLFPGKGLGISSTDPGGWRWCTIGAAWVKRRRGEQTSGRKLIRVMESDRREGVSQETESAVDEGASTTTTPRRAGERLAACGYRIQNLFSRRFGQAPLSSTGTRSYASEGTFHQRDRPATRCDRFRTTLIAEGSQRQ